ncbi:uncharacterized [Tachysurus ichikawai]
MCPSRVVIVWRQPPSAAVLYIMQAYKTFSFLTLPSPISSDALMQENEAHHGSYEETHGGHQTQSGGQELSSSQWSGYESPGDGVWIHLPSETLPSPSQLRAVRSYRTI